MFTFLNLMRHFFNRLFATSTSEVRGFLVLAVLTIVLSIGVCTLDILTRSEIGFAHYKTINLDSIASLIEDDLRLDSSSRAQVYTPQLFDPNIASLQILVANGLDTVVARRLIKYRDKGGVFRIKNDLAKIYGLSEDLFEQLYPFIDLPEEEGNLLQKANVQKESIQATIDPKKIVAVKKKEIPPFDLNTADTSIYQTVYGIGSVLSRRIVAFRSALGGFVDPNQLYAVYGLDSAIVGSLLSRGYISPVFQPEKIFINRQAEQELAHHPYISKKLARLLIAYRNQHGNYPDRSALLEVYLVDETFVENIDPYLDFTGN